MINNTKKCSKCQQELPFENFSKGTGKYKLKNYCKICSNVKDKLLYQLNKEERIEAATIWNEENEELVKSYKKKWAEKNK